MKKLIEVNGSKYIVEKDGFYWCCRINDCLILMPTIKEMKQAIKKETA